MHACLKLPTGNTLVVDKIYIGAVSYKPWCNTCGARNPAWISPGSNCSECASDTSEIRPGVVCVECAGSAINYCKKCEVIVSDTRASMLCVSCECEEGYVPLRTRGLQVTGMCRNCTKKQYVDSNGLCKNCFRSKRVELYYKAHAYLKKCATCNNPAEKGKYCQRCSSLHNNCGECGTPIKSSRVLCHEHTWDCAGCGRGFNPSTYVDILCKNCKTDFEFDGLCVGCGGFTDRTSDGLCVVCEKDFLEKSTCRRCHVTKGVVICSDCWKQSYTCSKCEEVNVHAKDFMCENCKLPF